MGDISRWVINRLEQLSTHKDSCDIFLKWINDNVVLSKDAGFVWKDEQ